MRPLKRRQFLFLAGSACAAGAVDRRCFAAESIKSLRQFQQTAHALGSQVSLTVLHENQEAANAALREAFTELELVESLLSIYRPTSQVSMLNRDGYIERAHPYLLEVLASATDLSRRTSGAFDITVQPLWQLYRASHQQQRERTSLPDSAAIERARQRVGWQRVAIEGHTVQLRGTGTQITLNGIAQGFAADKVSAVLQRHEIKQALIDTGEFAGHGENAESRPWKIGIQHPRQEDAYLALAALSNRCLSTSGDYATSFSPDFKHHHIFDPQTGYSPTQLASVSVLANTATQADALSTAVFVLGIERGLQLIESLPGCDALLAAKVGTMRATRGFPLELA
jgi:thiamine biosynthesis lipoprotein